MIHIMLPQSAFFERSSQADIISELSRSLMDPLNRSWNFPFTAPPYNQVGHLPPKRYRPVCISALKKMGPFGSPAAVGRGLNRRDQESRCELSVAQPLLAWEVAVNSFSWFSVTFWVGRSLWHFSNYPWRLVISRILHGPKIPYLPLRARVIRLPVRTRDAKGKWPYSLRLTFTFRPKKQTRLNLSYTLWSLFTSTSRNQPLKEKQLTPHRTITTW